MCSFIISSLQRLPFCSFMRCLVTRGFLFSVFSFFSVSSFATHSVPDSTLAAACSVDLVTAQSACTTRFNNILSSASISVMLLLLILYILILAILLHYPPMNGYLKFALLRLLNVAVLLHPLFVN